MLVQKALKNAYIGEYKWKPWANTILYMPLNSTNTKNDIIWWHTTTQWGTVSYGTYWWVDCMNVTWEWYVWISSMTLPQQYTIIQRVNNINWWSYHWQPSNPLWRNLDFLSPRMWLSYNSSWYYSYEQNSYFWVSDRNKWFLVAISISNGSWTSYLMWANISKTWNVTSAPNWNTSTLRIWCSVEYIDQYFLWYISNVIIENRARTADEISEYYNQTKSNYWL